MNTAFLASTTTTVALPGWLDANTILQGLGPYVFLGVALLIFADCGILIGFLIPGDTLLFTLGLLIAQRVVDMPIWLACVILSVCAVVGNVTGYYIGAAVGPKLFSNPDSKIFKRKHIEHTHEFFEKYGARAIILARFVPIVRTFITAVAGISKMDQRKFFTYSAVGGVAWAVIVPLLGFFLGQVPLVHDHLEIFLIAIPVLSVIPIVFEVIKGRRERQAKEAAGETPMEATQQFDMRGEDMDATQRIDRIR
ncbi:DedA family protein [Kutzneria sp. CA-103260]|uniref:DedA family protein n=1 Tax=Kutzneria sp. CA-103260 TaxID=2802641 RepID=UPI001BF02684|nr:VTT domain-containing protein [Kutzneria sp. CA-103260]QUQ70206.1 DedA-like membrane protein [Kutzneria sp. CA-103260]